MKEAIFCLAFTIIFSAIARYFYVHVKFIEEKLYGFIILHNQEVIQRKPNITNIDDFKSLFIHFRQYAAVDPKAHESGYAAVRLVERCEEEIKRIQLL